VVGTLAWLAIDPERPEVRASTWRLCLDERCTSERQVLTTTSDGFATATAMDLGSPSTIEAVGGGAFVVIHPEGRSLLRPGEELLPLELDRTRSAVAGDEVLVSWLGPGVQWAAIDPESATAHAIPLPQGGVDQLVQQPDGRLVGTTYYGESGVSWSDDGGATWAQRRLSGVAGFSTYQVLPSLEPSTIAVAEGTDGATLFPYMRVHRSTDGGATWDVVEVPEVEGDQARLGWAHVRPDGSLVSYMSGWSGARANRPGPHPHGPYESAGSDWSQLLPVEPGLPDDDVELLDLTREGLYAGSGAQAYASTDGGSTWEPTPAR
jgi:hypothetical protein